MSLIDRAAARMDPKSRQRLDTLLGIVGYGLSYSGGNPPAIPVPREDHSAELVTSRENVGSSPVGSSDSGVVEKLGDLGSAIGSMVRQARELTPRSPELRTRVERGLDAAVDRAAELGAQLNPVSMVRRVRAIVRESIIRSAENLAKRVVEWGQRWNPIRALIRARTAIRDGWVGATGRLTAGGDRVARGWRLGVSAVRHLSPADFRIARIWWPDAPRVTSSDPPVVEPPARGLRPNTEDQLHSEVYDHTEPNMSPLKLSTPTTHHPPDSAHGPFPPADTFVDDRVPEPVADLAEVDLYDLGTMDRVDRDDPDAAFDDSGADPDDSGHVRGDGSDPRDDLAQQDAEMLAEIETDRVLGGDDLPETLSGEASPVTAAVAEDEPSGEAGSVGAGTASANPDPTTVTEPVSRWSRFTRLFRRRRTEVPSLLTSQASETPPVSDEPGSAEPRQPLALARLHQMLAVDHAKAEAPVEAEASDGDEPPSAEAPGAGASGSLVDSR